MVQNWVCKLALILYNSVFSVSTLEFFKLLRGGNRSPVLLRTYIWIDVYSGPQKNLNEHLILLLISWFENTKHEHYKHVIAFNISKYEFSIFRFQNMKFMSKGFNRITCNQDSFSNFVKSRSVSINEIKEAISGLWHLLVIVFSSCHPRP